jgi:hypothetical protein
MVSISFSNFEKRAESAAYEGFWTKNLVQEKALVEETACMLAVLLLCNQFGIVLS